MLLQLICSVCCFVVQVMVCMMPHAFSINTASTTDAFTRENDTHKTAKSRVYALPSVFF